MFNKIKAASDMMKNIDPTKLKEMMDQAQEMKKMLEDTVRKIVDEEIKSRNLVSRDEVEKMIK